jgi:hypothetical protein
MPSKKKTPVKPGKVKKQVTVTPEVFDFFRELGAGSASSGLQIAKMKLEKRKA